MKIVYLHQYFKFPDETGGTRSFDLACSFLTKGHQVEVISATPNPAYRGKKRWFLLHKNGLKVHYIYLPYDNRLSYLKRTLIFLEFLWFSTFKLLSLKCDVVLATSTPLTIGIPALIKKWRQKTPFVFEVRDVWPEAVIAIGAIKNKLIRRLLYRLEYVIYKNAVAIVPLSVDMKASILKRFPEFSKKISVVVENISEVNRFREAVPNSVLSQKLGIVPRFSVLYAGTFGKVNGIDYVVRLASMTIKTDPTLVFIMIGNGADKENVAQLAIEAGVINKNLFILDAVAKEELPHLYAEVDMGSSFVIPIKELWANSANKFFDTLAAGKPVLINHEGWQAEVIRSCNVGYVLPNVLSQENVMEFVQYTQNTDLQKQQRGKALKKAIESYSLEVAAEKYNSIFQNIDNNIRNVQV